MLFQPGDKCCAERDPMSRGLGLIGTGAVGVIALACANQIRGSRKQNSEESAPEEDREGRLAPTGPQPSPTPLASSIRPVPPPFPAEPPAGPSQFQPWRPSGNPPTFSEESSRVASPSGNFAQPTPSNAGPPEPSSGGFPLWDLRRVFFPTAAPRATPQAPPEEAGPVYGQAASEDAVQDYMRYGAARKGLSVAAPARGPSSNGSRTAAGAPGPERAGFGASSGNGATAPKSRMIKIRRSRGGEGPSVPGPDQARGTSGGGLAGGGSGTARSGAETPGGVLWVRAPAPEAADTILGSRTNGGGRGISAAVGGLGRMLAGGNSEAPREPRPPGGPAPAVSSSNGLLWAREPADGAEEVATRSAGRVLWERDRQVTGPGGIPPGGYESAGPGPRRGASALEQGLGSSGGPGDQEPRDRQWGTEGRRNGSHGVPLPDGSKGNGVHDQNGGSRGLGVGEGSPWLLDPDFVLDNGES
jgi:hypothetical protein